MNTLHFKYAVEVGRTGSISQAAENLFMAQPNLSKAIKELEDTLGIVIFERTSKGVIPTDAGREFLEYAQTILVQLEKMESIYIPKSEIDNTQILKLSVFRGSYIMEGFGKFLAELDMNKGIDIRIDEAGSLKIIENVTDNGYSLGIIRYQTMYETYYVDYLREKNLRRETIWEFPRLVLMSERHELADSEEIDLSKLIETSVEIVNEDDMVPYLSLPEVRRPISRGEHGLKRIRVHERGSQLELLSKLPQAYMWASPLSRELLSRYGLVQRSCNMSNNMYKDVLIYPVVHKLSVLEKLFLNKLYEAKNDVAFSDYV